MRVRSLFAVLAVLLFLLVACGGLPATVATPAPSASAHFPLVVTDDRGKQVTFAGPVQRIVSVAPSATEIVFAIGAGDRIVAVDDFSDFPAEAKALPKVGGFRASPERILSFAPDVVLAVPTGDLAPTLESQGQRVLVFDPPDIEAVYRNIAQIGAILGRDAGARAVLSRRLAHVFSHQSRFWPAGLSRPVRPGHQPKRRRSTASPASIEITRYY